MNFNLIEEAWIPVLYRTGLFKRVGIRTALEEAGLIRQIAASNPMDNVAMLRLLLPVFQRSMVESQPVVPTAAGQACKLRISEEKAIHV